MGPMRGIAGLGIAATVVLVFALVVAGACFGGNGDSSQAPGTHSLTNPASAPTSTPISGDVVFVIGPGGISLPGADRTATPATTPSGTGGSYTVEGGDTCAGIADLFGITFAELRTANPVIDEGCRNLRPGQVLRIPAGSSGGSTNATPIPGGSGGDTYEVAPGDNCGSIAAAHGVTLEAFLVINGLSEDDCTNLQVGQVLRIP